MKRFNKVSDIVSVVFVPKSGGAVGIPLDVTSLCVGIRTIWRKSVYFLSSMDIPVKDGDEFHIANLTTKELAFYKANRFKRLESCENIPF